MTPSIGILLDGGARGGEGLCTAMQLRPRGGRGLPDVATGRWQVGCRERRTAPGPLLSPSSVSPYPLQPALTLSEGGILPAAPTPQLSVFTLQSWAEGQERDVLARPKPAASNDVADFY